MKLRLNESSVRLRVRRSEVEQFAQSGSVFAGLEFPAGGALRFGLEAAEVPEPVVSFTGGSVLVRVPREAATRWSSGRDVGIYGRHGDIDILVEKDFRRTSLPSPDDADRYPNPRAKVNQA